MNLAAWIASGLLAAANLAGGFTKLVRPLSDLRTSMGWVDDVGERVVRLIGALEIAGALGLVLPKLVGIVDERDGVEGTLTGLAASGLLAIQVLAVPVHLRRKEPTLVLVNLALGGLAAFIATARFGWL